MNLYQIIETDAGLMVAELAPDMAPEVVAERAGGVVVDPGPYNSFDEAYDAMMALGDEDDEPEEPPA